MLVVAVGVVAVGWWGGAIWMQARAQAKAVAIMPAMPESASMPPALATKIETAMAVVKSGDRTGLIELAALYAANGWDENARRCLQGLRQLDPKNPRWAPDADPWDGNLYQWCYEPERLMDEAAALIAADDKAGARLRLERALLLDPTNGSLHWKAALASEAMRDQVQALAHYEQAVEYDVTLADASLRLATLQRAIGESSKAWQTLMQGVKANPEAAALLLARGSAYAEREQFERAFGFIMVPVLILSLRKPKPKADGPKRSPMNKKTRPRLPRTAPVSFSPRPTYPERWPTRFARSRTTA